MKIEWLGHATFIITSESGIKILTDPYEPGGFSGAIRYNPINQKVDLVTVSHSHSDHCHIPVGLSKDTPVIRDRVKESLKGITIRSVDSFHDSNNGRERGSNSIFLFDIDGIKVVHFGDLGHILDDAKIKEIGQVDVALIPVGGKFTINAKQAGDIINKIKPKVVIPMHFKTDKLGFDIDKVEKFLKGKENIQQLGYSEIEINPDMLQSAVTRIIVLRPSH